MFTIGQELADFLVSCGILSKAWEESDLASNSESFSLTEHEGVAYVAFPSFHKIEGFIVEENKYGVGNIHNYNNVFSDCLKGNDDKPAFVQQGALKLFLHIMEKTDFQAKLQIYTDSKQRRLKPIIFVGHSLGGAVATLATLWVLGKRLRQSSPFCITFGCPLVGDERLVEAVGREHWVGNFLHVVSKHDIVPRMLLAPLKSIAQPLTAIFPYWHGKVPYSFIQDACKTLLENVRQCTCTLGGSDGVIERSPYKPFGTYMFCSRHGAACIDHSETVLKMLQWTMQSHEKLSDNIVQDWFSEHMAYGSILKHVIENSIIPGRIVHSNSESFYEMGISLQLDAIGVGAQNDHTWTFFPIAGDFENHLNKNVEKLAMELRFKQAAMAELEWYKEGCERKDGIAYYDSMKNFDSSRDIAADSHRVKLAEFWDEVIEMWESHELPSDFESQNKWINAGTAYRRLVEPLDIAHYYRIKYNGDYLSDGRPNRHKVLQKWMEAKDQTRTSRGQRHHTKDASLTQDSCFWAYVEEAWKDLENLKQGQHESLENLENFEKYVTMMENALSISSDVFLKGSSFMRWWEEWKEFNKNQFPGWSSSLYDIMERKSRFSFTDVVKEESPSTCVVKEEIPSSKEESPSTGGVIKNIPSTKEIDHTTSFLPMAGDIENPLNKNVAKLTIELSEKQCIMAELEWYKERCEKEDGITYYDSIKNLDSLRDIHADIRRKNLAGLWEEIIEMWENHEFPSDFEYQDKWINAGNTYRGLVEPLDIAHYYRTNGNGNYLSDGRPNRHKVLQKWMEAKEKTHSSRGQRPRTKRASLTRDSCFWAYVEEAWKDLENLKQGQHESLEKLEKFEEYVTTMENAGKV